MKTYTLMIVYDDNTDEIEYIEEEITEDRPDVLFKLTKDPKKIDKETVISMMSSGLIVGES